MKKYIVIMTITGLLSAAFGGSSLGEDLVWENIGKEISEVNVVLLDKLNPKYIYLGTTRGLFKTKDAGGCWYSDTRLNKNINFLFQDKQSLIYAASASGLFISQDQGSNWRRLFRSKNAQENNCQSVAVSQQGEIYLGTNSGLLVSKDRGKFWHKVAGKLGSIAISAIAEDAVNKIIYAVGANKVFKSNDGFYSYNEIFTSGSAAINSQNEGGEEFGPDESMVSLEINYIAVDPNMPNRLGLATAAGVYISQDQGATWNLLSDFGLLSKKIKFILFSRSAVVYAGNNSGIFVYHNERWQELSLRLPAGDTRFLAMDNEDNLYAATDKGIFKARQNELVARKENEYFKDEPDINELHQAAIKYAQVIDPRKIDNLRIQARLKAILPELSLDYDKTVTSYSNTAATRFSVGPSEWGVSLKWSLSDLIWSEQQRLIDSQVRLMVQLRDDILDEVTKLYFERLRVKIETDNLTIEDKRKRFEKELRLEEITAMLDGLTGGYFSQHIRNNAKKRMN